MTDLKISALLTAKGNNTLKDKNLRNVLVPEKSMPDIEQKENNSINAGQK